MADNGALSNSVQEVRGSALYKKVMEKPPLPVDHGWAWAVMLGAFCNICFIMLFLRSSSVLFIQFLETYKESATMTTLAFGLCSATFALCNILGPTYLLRRFEVRTLAVIGAIINFLSIFVMAFASSMILIDLMMACIGFSHGLMSVPQMTLIGQYFVKRLSFSSAFVNLGLSIGTIAGPPLAQFLLDTYGLKGTIMIIAGLNMHCIPASMLFRPVSKYADPLLNNVEDEIEKADFKKDSCQEVIQEETEEETHLEDMTEKQIEMGHVYNINDFNSAEEVASLINKPNFPKPLLTRSISEGIKKDISETSNHDVVSALANSDLNLKILDRRESIVSDVIDRINISTSIRYLTDSSIFMEGFVSRERNSHQREHLEREESLSEVMTVDAIYSESGKNVTTSVYNETVEPNLDNNVTCLSKIRTSISESIYFHPLGLLILLASAFGVHTQTCIAYMPATGKENGLTDNEIPYLVTVIGVCDLISKLGIGVFADLGYVKRIHITCACAFVCGTVMQFVRFFDGFGLMILLQVLLGLTVGVTHAMVAVIIVDILGVKYMGHIMAGYFLVNGMMMSIEHIIIGSIKDFTGSFLTAYNYVGSIVLLSAFLFLLEPLIAKIRPAPK